MPSRLCLDIKLHEPIVVITRLLRTLTNTYQSSWFFEDDRRVLRKAFLILAGHCTFVQVDKWTQG